jgi:UPF0716 protein FxsA
MKFLVLLIFIGVPLAEIAVFIKVGEVIGIGATVALVILTAVIGVALLKRQGLAAMARARESVEAGELPVESVIDGVCLLVAGAFLLTPGLITDTAGFLLLVPAFRHGVAHWAFAKLRQSGNFQVWTSGPGMEPGGGGPNGGRGGGRGDVIIETEYEEVRGEVGRDDEEDAETPKRGSGNSPWRR